MTSAPTGRGWAGVAMAHRAGIQVAIDAFAWAAGLTFAVLVRFDFTGIPVSAVGLLLVVATAVALQAVVGFLLYLYRGRHRFGSFEEVLSLAAVVGVATLVLLVGVLAPGERPVPASTPVAGGLTAFVLMAATRYAWRLFLERTRRTGAARQPLLVFGAGEAGAQIVRSLLHDRRARLLPVGLLDDDPSKRNLRLFGVRVLGDRHAIAQAAEQTGALSLLIAIPSAEAELVREVTATAEAAGLTVKVVPSVAELVDDQVTVSDIRDIDLADLLGRHQVETDVESIAGYLTGRRVLVTGAGGSIGSELCRQLYQFGPAELMMLDRDESALHAVQLSISGRALLDTPDLILADIRDRDRLRRVFEERRPDVVFHAAALKHLPLLEQYPGEAVQSNVWGTLTVLEAARASGVGRFVNISTDKAADPTSVLGYSKRLAERLTAHVGAQSDGVFVSVRFGNVLGSRGSVLTAFAAQVAAGGPVTVTDPEVTRYFMTVQESVQLVIQAGAIGRSGEALVLDMGDPVRIAEVARRLSARSRTPVDVVFTGLRPGEKLHEALLAEGEADERPVHQMISHVPVPGLDPGTALTLDAWSAAAVVTRGLQRMVSHPDSAAGTRPVPFHRQPESAPRQQLPTPG